MVKLNQDFLQSELSQSGKLKETTGVLEKLQLLLLQVLQVWSPMESWEPILPCDSSRRPPPAPLQLLYLQEPNGNRP